METQTDFLCDQTSPVTDLSKNQNLSLESLLPRAQRLSGFGQSVHADGYVFRPTSPSQVLEIFQLAKQLGRKVVLRGAGRSYGDAAIGTEAIVVEFTRMRQVIDWNPETGVIDCQSGVTIEGLWRMGLEDGWWPPVVSGTMYPTLAGALGMNIHGKNNFAVGTLGEHVLEIDVVTPDQGLITLTPADELFYAVISGFGMLGAIVRAKLQMKRVQSGNVKVLALNPANWDEQFSMFEQYEHQSDYMVTWIDCFARRAKAGRGQFHAAWYVHVEPPDHFSMLEKNQDLPDTILGFLPKSVVWRFLKPLNNRWGMRLLNAAKDSAGRKLGEGKIHEQSLVGFSFLLDYVPRWRDTYLPDGFIQFQSFVPKEHARRVFSRQVEMQQEAKLESFLGVMKRHRADRFLFTHAVDGYSLALDFKVTAKNREQLWELCHRMSDVVLEAGGRFYFAKDSTLRSTDVSAYLGAETLSKFGRFKSMVDKNQILSSALFERLFPQIKAEN